MPAKKVIAIDIEQRFLNYIEDRKTEMYDKNLAAKIETRLTKPNDPMLVAEEVDIILVVNTISFIDNRSQITGWIDAFKINKNNKKRRYPASSYTRIGHIFQTDYIRFISESVNSSLDANHSGIHSLYAWLR